MLEVIRERAKKLSLVNKKYETIVKILEDDRCFEKMDISDSLSVLRNLGFDDSQTEKIYLQLIRK